MTRSSTRGSASNDPTGSWAISPKWSSSIQHMRAPAQHISQRLEPLGPPGRPGGVVDARGEEHGVRSGTDSRFERLRPGTVFIRFHPDHANTRVVPGVEDRVVPWLLHGDNRVRPSAQAADDIRGQNHKLLGGRAEQKFRAFDRNAIRAQPRTQNLSQCLDRLHGVVLQVAIADVVERGQPVPFDELHRQ
jgi:hypothetical protein